MYSFVIEDEKQAYEEHPADYFHFNWQYTNDYDSDKGTSMVSVIRIYKPQGVVIILKMLTESLELFVYTGYMEGSLDFSVFQ